MLTNLGQETIIMLTVYVLEITTHALYLEERSEMYSGMPIVWIPLRPQGQCNVYTYAPCRQN